MRFLGIDYGTKRVGLALSDEEGTMAFPKRVVPNSARLVREIEDIIKKERVEAIVVGESKNYKGEDNKIMDEVRAFVETMKRQTALPVYFEPEFLTSAEAAHVQPELAKLDASAAAIILQSYLDKERLKR